MKSVVILVLLSALAYFNLDQIKEKKSELKNKLDCLIVNNKKDLPEFLTKKYTWKDDLYCSGKKLIKDTNQMVKESL